MEGNNQPGLRTGNGESDHNPARTSPRCPDFRNGSILATGLALAALHFMDPWHNPTAQTQRQVVEDIIKSSMARPERALRIAMECMR